MAHSRTKLVDYLQAPSIVTMLNYVVQTVTRPENWIKTIWYEATYRIILKERFDLSLIVLWGKQLSLHFLGAHKNRCNVLSCLTILTTICMQYSPISAEVFSSTNNHIMATILFGLCLTSIISSLKIVEFVSCWYVSGVDFRDYMSII